MNTNGNEFTIFNGAPSIHLNNSGARIEEEEELQDQIRRKAELQKELENAFGDLDEDEDDDIDSTRYSSRHSNGNQGNKCGKQSNQPFHMRDENSHLKNLLDSKTREIEYVTNELTNERKKYKSQLDEYEKRLSIAEAEKERALMTRGQTHELLVENKAKMIDMEDQNNTLRTKIKNLESENSQMVAEIESTKLMLSDTQLKYSMVEKNAHFNADRNADMILKQAQERHSAQMTMMQQQIDTLKTKYDDIHHEHKNIDIRYKELQRSRECMLIEKSEIINQLNKSLEDAQRQCQDLLSRPNLSQENRRLQNAVTTQEAQMNEMAKSISKLQEKLQTQTSELELMDTMIHESGGNNTSFSETNFIMQRNLMKNATTNSSTPFASSDDRIIRLKDELMNSISNIKIKREEIKILEIQLSDKNQEIKQLKNDENRALVDLIRYKDEAVRLEGKTKILEIELDRMRDKLNKSTSNDREKAENSIEKYEDEIKNLQSNNNELQENLDGLKTDYEKLNMQNYQLMDNEQEWQQKLKDLEMQVYNPKNDSRAVEMELAVTKEKVDELQQSLKTNEVKYDQLIKDLETEKAEKEHQLIIIQDKLSNMSLPENSEKYLKNKSNECIKCEEYRTTISKLELKSLQYQNANADNLKELNEMKQDLEEAHKTVENLTENLSFKKMRDEEIERLKKKAEEFEHFMRNTPRTNSNVSTSKSSSMTNSSLAKNDVSTSTSPNFIHESREEVSLRNHETETKIRNEMAKIFAKELKNIEKIYREEIDRLKNELLTVNEELAEKDHELVVRNQQFDILKFTILKEREVFENEYKQKDQDFSAAIENYRKEYEVKLRRCEELETQLNNIKDAMDEKRFSIESLKRHLEEERQLFKRRESETEKKVKKLQKVIGETNERYLSAKKTAQNYKQYSDEKEEHMKREYTRIKDGYTTSTEKVQSRMKEILNSKEIETSERIEKLQKEYEFKIDVLKEGLLKRLEK